MSEPRGFDLDGETTRAWSAFTRRLADRLADMGDGETLTLGLSGASHACQPGTARLLFSVLPDGRLRRTEIAPDDEVAAELDCEQRDADLFAAESVDLLRESHGIMHPAFLSVAGESYAVASGEDGGSDTGLDDQPTAQLTEPVDASHLLELAFATITHGLGREPTRDIDGDLIVEAGSTRVFVRVLKRTPVIQLFSRLVHEITHPDSAPAVVGALNNDYPFVKFLFADRAVIASVHLPAIPFVPAQLRHMLAIFSELADELDDQLVRRLGGEREIDELARADRWVEEEEPDGVPPELMMLLRLDPEGLGLDPERTAEICGYDPGLTRQLLHIAIGQQEVWQDAAREVTDDPAEETRCAEEAAGWEATRRSLSGALELIESLHS
jgi:type III secretion system-like peptide-binding chaperone/Chap domain-containing protein